MQNHVADDADSGRFEEKDEEEDEEEVDGDEEEDVEERSRR